MTGRKMSLSSDKAPTEFILLELGLHFAQMRAGRDLAAYG